MNAAWLRSLAVFTFFLLSVVSVDAADRRVPETRAQIALSFAPVVKSVAPAVVNIQTQKEVMPAVGNPFADDPFFRFFFRDFPQAPQRRMDRVERSLGSGVIVSDDGLIVTNYHVIEDADEIEVILNDRREFGAEVLLMDGRSDLAMIRIDPEDETLPAIELGDSDAIEVGDLVLALGNPFGIGQTVTSGIVSAKARTAPQIDSEVSFIQTDAAVNPGNSGGALVTLDGKLIGINTAIFTRGGGSIGIGFAIPSNLLATKIASLERGEDGDDRPWLGVAINTVDANMAEALGLRRPRGVIIRNVHPKSAADRAGLEIGDVILAVDGYEVRDGSTLGFRLALGSLGENTVLDVLRDGYVERREVSLEPPFEDPPRQIRRPEPSHALHGIVIGNLSPKFAEELGVDMFEHGVIVLEVYRRTRADRIGLRPRDILVAIDGKKVTHHGDLDGYLGQRGQLWQLSIKRNGQVRTVTISG